MDDWEMSGKISAEALEYGSRLIKVGINAIEVLDKIENKIYELGGKPSFPAQVSINDLAAHVIPEKDAVFNEGDIIKLDVGAHINGCVTDNAKTIDLGDNKKLLEASKKALNEAIKIISPGVMLYEIGDIIERTITKLGFKPIKNLFGHGIDIYDLHSGFTIPNFNNNDETELQEDQIIAIEPFATNGVGLIKDGKLSGIYKITNIKQVRDNNAREILKFIFENYNTLPFAKRWLLKKFPEFKVNFALRNLEKENVIYHYPQLHEKSHGLVSQHEFTVLVRDKAKVLTKVD